MAPSRPGLTPLRRVVGGALVVLLLVGAVLYYRASTNIPVASSSTTHPSPTPSATATPSQPSRPGASGESGPTPIEVGPIEVYVDRVIKARPFETVRIRGTYHGAPETFLRVQLRDGSTWVDYPIQPKTDWLGRFIAHVELGEAGPHWLRVVDPGADLPSEPFVVLIKG